MATLVIVGGVTLGTPGGGWAADESASCIGRHASTIAPGSRLGERVSVAARHPEFVGASSFGEYVSESNLGERTCPEPN